MKKQKGFTLIELVMVIAILVILAAIAIPKYYDLTSKAKEASEAGVVGGVRAGVMTYLAGDTLTTGSPAFPAALDTAATGDCTTANECFANVLRPGITQGPSNGGWTKVDTVTYKGPNAIDYWYDSSDGGFTTS